MWVKSGAEGYRRHLRAFFYSFSLPNVLFVYFPMKYILLGDDFLQKPARMFIKLILVAENAR